MEELVMGKQMKYGTIVWMDRSHVVGTKSDLFIFSIRGIARISLPRSNEITVCS